MMENWVKEELRRTIMRKENELELCKPCKLCAITRLCCQRYVGGCSIVDKYYLIDWMK